MGCWQTVQALSLLLLTINSDINMALYHVYKYIEYTCIMAEASSQVTAPKRSQSSQDMVHLHQHPSRPTPSLASTPEKPDPPPLPPHAAEGQQKGSSKRDQPLSNGQPQRAGGLGLLGRVASGLLGSSSRRGSSEKKVSGCRRQPRCKGTRRLHECVWPSVTCKQSPCQS